MPGFAGFFMRLLGGAVPVAVLFMVGPSFAAEKFAAQKPGIASICTQAGGTTSSGERFASEKLTAAHRTLPFGTMVRVTNRRNGKTVVVRIVDRGPYGRGRVIDLSRAAAVELDMIGSGTAIVDIDRQ